jgi:membrane associated rhomboid family serine protease
MLRSRGENLRSVYVLLFLNIAFFFFQVQDPNRYAAFFSFNQHAVAAGQWWRLFTYQFVQGGQGLFFFPPPLALFFTLILLHLFGSAIEEELGTFHFLVIYALSLFGSAALASVLHIALLGTFFLSYTLMFVAATLFPDQTLYIFMVIPLRVRWVAIGIAVWLVYSVFAEGTQALPALGGAVLSYGYFLMLRAVPAPRPRGYVPVAKESDSDRQAERLVQIGTRNLARVAAVKHALVTANDTEIDRLIELSSTEVVRGVNICPPADYKPEAADGYCVRCEGFAECTARHLRLNRPQKAAPDGIAPAGT